MTESMGPCLWDGAGCLQWIDASFSLPESSRNVFGITASKGWMVPLSMMVRWQLGITALSTAKSSALRS